MKMGKKLLAVALAGVLALSVLTGCSGSSDKVTGKKLAESMTKLGIKVEYNKDLDKTAQNTLNAIQTVIKNTDTKLEDTVGKNGEIIKEDGSCYSFGLLGKKTWLEDDDHITDDTVAKALGLDVMDEGNDTKQVQVALVKIDNAKTDATLQAVNAKDAMVLANQPKKTAFNVPAEEKGVLAETGKMGYATTDDGNYLMVVIITDVLDSTPVA